MRPGPDHLAIFEELCRASPPPGSAALSRSPTLTLAATMCGEILGGEARILLGRLLADPGSLVPGVRTNALGQVSFSLAANGTLAHVPGAAVAAAQNALVWLDEQGRQLSVLAQGFYEDVDISPDGRRVAARMLVEGSGGSSVEMNGERHYDVAAIDLERGERRVLLDSAFNETLPRVSPGGQLLAYVSDREGERRVYVTTYPEPGAHLLVSPELASYPQWSPDGRRLYYHREGADAAAAVIERQPELRVVAREELFNTDRFSLGNGWDVSPDGRFLMARVPSDAEGATAHASMSSSASPSCSSASCPPASAAALATRLRTSAASHARPCRP